MPNPTTKPKPSPKSPPVCKKGPAKTAGPDPPAAARYLTALIGAFLAQTGLPAGVNMTMTLNPQADPLDWLGSSSAPGFFAEVWLGKQAGLDLYDVYLEFSVAGSPFYGKLWSNVTPTVENPLSLPDLSYKDPSTGDTATLTISA